MALSQQIIEDIADDAAALREALKKALNTENFIVIDPVLAAAMPAIVTHEIARLRYPPQQAIPGTRSGTPMSLSADKET
jgi:hypothetical protein